TVDRCSGCPPTHDVGVDQKTTTARRGFGIFSLFYSALRVVLRPDFARQIVAAIDSGDSGAGIGAPPLFPTLRAALGKSPAASTWWNHHGRPLSRGTIQMASANTSANRL